LPKEKRKWIENAGEIGEKNIRVAKNAFFPIFELN
jgi:hypothetical protein